MNINKTLLRCGSETKSPFYSIPQSGQRFNYFQGKNLAFNPTYQLNGTLSRKSVQNNQTQEIKIFSKVNQEIRPKDNDIFNTVTTKENIFTSAKPHSMDYNSNFFSYRKSEPIKLKVKTNNTFRSHCFDSISTRGELTRQKSELKQCNFSIYTTTSQIALLPGGNKRQTKDIKDDFSTDLNSARRVKTCPSSTKSLSVNKQKTNLKNIPSDIFKNSYSNYLFENQKKTDNYRLSTDTNNFITNLKASKNERKKHFDNNVFLKSKISANDKEKVLSGISKKNTLHMQLNQTPKNIIDSIYNPLQDICHKKCNDIMKNKIVYVNNPLF